MEWMKYGMNELDLIELVQLSPYDDSFPKTLLQEAFDFRVKESERITEKLYQNIIKKFPNQ